MLKGAYLDERFNTDGEYIDKPNVKNDQLKTSNAKERHAINSFAVREVSEIICIFVGQKN